MRLIVMVVLAVFASAQITSLTFKSFPDNDDSKCVFIMTLANDDYDDDEGPTNTAGSAAWTITADARSGYVGYAEVFHGKDESNPVSGDKDLSCTYVLKSLGSDNNDEQFEVIGCTIYNDYEEEVDTYMEGSLVIERYEVDSVWIE